MGNFQLVLLLFILLSSSSSHGSYMCTRGHPHISSHGPLKTSSHFAARIHVSSILTRLCFGKPSEVVPALPRWCKFSMLLCRGWGTSCWRSSGTSTPRCPCRLSTCPRFLWTEPAALCGPASSAESRTVGGSADSCLSPCSSGEGEGSGEGGGEDTVAQRECPPRHAAHSG